MSGLALPDFCVPAPGSGTLRAVISGALRRALKDLRAVLRVHAGGPLGADAAALARIAGWLAREQPGALVTALRRPEIGVVLRCLRPGAAHPVDPMIGMPALLGGIALELARTRALPEPLRLRALPPRLVSSAGRLHLPIPRDAQGLRFEPGRVVVERSAGPCPLSLVPSDEAFVALAGSAARLALVDTNPLFGLEDHPDKDGNRLELGGRPVARWREALERALLTVGEHLPALREELELIVQQLVPVGYFPRKHLSASIQEAIGTIYLSLHPNPMTMVEAVIHEASHNKLGALFELDPVLHNASEAADHASPVRPDKRPLRGVLLAVHAFLPVAALYRAMLAAGAPGTEHPEFSRRLREIDRGNAEAAAVLREHARPTPAGAQVLAEIEARARG